jgi:hypothetical protein
MWEHPRHAASGRARPIAPWAAETGATRDTPQSNFVYVRLLATGQVKKVALTACRHTLLTMLNAMLKPRTPWQPQEVQS